ncbi:MAG: ABC transporter permease [Myxococcales bacterium]|nr:ABC transporter permease [Myxococcales bacterium]MCB9521150.1 ABC transporter permease [Myxococcales bacterium]MCB9530176.1 ABC transporter permease [Myxococcales bacterium]MCB9534158.1 ABC transporter permease [Myxococcales bacterium]
MKLFGDIDLEMALAVWRRNLTVYRRTWKMNILPNFFEPVLYLVGMGVGLGSYLGEDVGGTAYVAFIAPGLMAASAMNGATFETTYNIFIKMNFARVYDAFLGTPAQVQDIAFGELLWATTRALLYGLAFLLVTAALTVAGLPILTSPWALGLPLVLALTGVLFAALGELFTSLVKTIDLYSYYYTLFMTPLFLFSGIFYPVDRFPHGAAIAWFTPLYHAVRACRALATGDVGVATAADVTWIAVVAALAFAVVPRRTRAMLIR